MAFGAAAVASMRVDTLHLILHLLLRVALLTQKQPPCPGQGRSQTLTLKRARAAAACDGGNNTPTVRLACMWW